MSVAQANTGISAEQLQEILKTVIAEVRKPPELTPEQLAEKQQHEDMRRERGEMELAMIEQRKIEQKYCSHKQPNGTSAVAHVNKGLPGEFLICQHCRAKIKKAQDPTDEPSQEFIYNENLFWSLVQATSQTTF